MFAQPRLQFVAAIVIFAFWGVIARSIHLPAPLLLAVVCGGGALACVVYRPRPVRWSRGAIAVGLILAADLLLLILAFQRTDFATVVALHNAGPLLVVVLAPLVTRDPFRLSSLVQVALGVAAVAVICGVKLGHPTARDATGMWLALLSTFTFAANILAQRRLMKYESDYKNAVLQYNIVLTAAFAVAAVVWTGASPHAGMPTGLALVGQIGVAVLAGAIVQGVAMLLFNAAARRLGCDDMARLSLLGPAITVLSGAVLYGERPTVLQLGALVVILAASLAPARAASAVNAPPAPL